MSIVEPTLSVRGDSVLSEVQDRTIVPSPVNIGDFAGCEPYRVRSRSVPGEKSEGRNPKERISEMGNGPGVLEE